MKRSLIIVTAMLLAVAIAVPVSAQRFWRGSERRITEDREETRINRRMLGNLTDEQREKIAEARKSFIDQTVDLRNDLRTKRTELINILSTAEPDAEKAKKIQKEISNIRGKLAQKRLELMLEMLKINPDARYGQGIMRNRMGFWRGIGAGLE
jgi:Spy/CpxP family protein refolding chaperone